LDDVVETINEITELGADCVVTLGAGSISDASKNIKLGHSNNVKTRDDLLKIKGKVNFAQGSIEVPDTPLNPPTLKLICIPTSLSAGEYNPKSGSLDRQSGKKYPFYQPDCMPDVIICDPYLAKLTPEWVWLSTGVRSVDHAVETICNPKIDLTDSSLAEAYSAAEEALVLLIEGLALSKDDPDNVEARDLCQRGAWKASLAIVRGIPMGGSHAIGHILGAVAGVAHGHTSCVCMPAVNRFNYKVNSKQQDHIKQILVERGIVEKLGLQDSPDLQPWEILLAFIKFIGMPHSLTEVGVKEQDFGRIAKETLTDFWSRMNPIPLDSEDQVMRILEFAK
jgi:maleylacetate reductase